MILKKMRAIVATFIVSVMALGSGIQPARADTTSTLLITAAAVAALMTGINVAQKNAKANQLVGYLPNGAPVYADGGVIGPNGQKYYPGNYGQNISCNAGRCFIQGAVGYNGGYGSPAGYAGYPQGYGGYPGSGGYAPGYGGYAPGYGGYAPGYGGYNPATTVTRTIVVRKVDNDRHVRDDDDRDNDGHHRHSLPPGIAKQLFAPPN